MSKYIPVGISQNELFMTEDVDHTDYLGQMIFCVIRPVTQSELEHLKSDDYIYERCDELWRERVKYDNTYTGGLDDFVEMAKNEMGYEDEDFIFKDCSFCEVLEDERKIYQPLPEWEGHVVPLTLRQFIDLWVEYNTGEAVGTWEASGFFPPQENDCHTPVKFDYVLNERAANIWYKQVGLK